MRYAGRRILRNALEPLAAVPTVEQLGGCRLRRPTRHRDPVDRLQALLDLEEPGNGPGRPAVAPEVRALIRRGHGPTENPGVGSSILPCPPFLSPARRRKPALGVAFRHFGSARAL
jgi:hypothetical protein